MTKKFQKYSNPTKVLWIAKDRLSRIVRYYGEYYHEAFFRERWQRTTSVRITNKWIRYYWEFKHLVLGLFGKEEKA